MIDKNKRTPEHDLWASVIMAHFEDAMGMFVLHKKKPLEMQYQQIRQEFIENKKVLYDRRELHMARNCSGINNSVMRSRKFFETSEFDTLAEILGYDSRFVNQTFGIVQQAITYERKIYEEFKANETLF